MLSYNLEVVIAPPSIYLIPVAELVRNDVKVAAQNCYIKLSGAFTGEIRCVLFTKIRLRRLTSIYSPAQLADAKIPYVILGRCLASSDVSSTDHGYGLL
jgi:triosephosphate isomerase (TIM)